MLPSPIYNKASLRATLSEEIKNVPLYQEVFEHGVPTSSNLIVVPVVRIFAQSPAQLVAARAVAQPADPCSVPARTECKTQTRLADPEENNIDLFESVREVSGCLKRFCSVVQKLKKHAANREVRAPGTISSSLSRTLTVNAACTSLEFCCFV